MSFWDGFVRAGGISSECDAARRQALRRELRRAREVFMSPGDDDDDLYSAGGDDNDDDDDDDGGDAFVAECKSGGGADEDEVCTC